MTPRGRRLVPRRGGRWGVALAIATLSITPPGATRASDTTDRSALMPPAPSGKFLLVRELHRSLDDGNVIVTRRSYRIDITRSGAIVQRSTVSSS